MPYFRASQLFWLRLPYLWIQSLLWWISIVSNFDIQGNPCWNRTLTYHFSTSISLNHDWTLGAERCFLIRRCVISLCTVENSLYDWRNRTCIEQYLYFINTDNLSLKYSGYESRQLKISSPWAFNILSILSVPIFASDKIRANSIANRRHGVPHRWSRGHTHASRQYPSP